MDMEKEAIEILMMFCKDECKIMDSGGKDSSVLKSIAIKCKELYGLNFEIIHNHTSIDAPETVYFIRDEKRKMENLNIKYTISYPDIYFDDLCVKKGMLPTRIARFCCAELKERYSEAREKIVTGVRKNESISRKKNQGVITILDKGKNADGKIATKNLKGGTIIMNYDNDRAREIVETCFRTKKIMVNPLINWTDDDIWRYIRDNKLIINPLYSCGWSRVGCIGCPMASYKGRVKEFERYPKFRERYIRIADEIVKKKKENGRDAFKTGLDYFRFWIEDPNVPGQMSFDEFGNITEDYT